MFRRGATAKDVAHLDVLFATANNHILWSNLSTVKVDGDSGPTYQRNLFEAVVLARGIYMTFDPPQGKDYLVNLCACVWYCTYVILCGPAIQLSCQHAHKTPKSAQTAQIL